MNSVVKLVTNDVDAIPFQEASLDIWEKKYRLVSKSGDAVDKTMDDTYKRVARALADVEPEAQREHWNERFLWALRRGAIPAGRVTSNAGALEHKPATSTINCTVSGTIRDTTLRRPPATEASGRRQQGERHDVPRATVDAAVGENLHVLVELELAAN